MFESFKGFAWYRVLWWMVAQKNGFGAGGLQKITGLGSYPTAWTRLHKCRRLMVVSGRDLLNGTVEAGETFVGANQRVREVEAHQVSV